MDYLVLVAMFPFLIETFLGLVCLAIILAFLSFGGIFFEEKLYPLLNKLFYGKYKSIKKKILREKNIFFDDYIFFIYFISTLVLVYVLFFSKEINEKILDYRLTMVKFLIAFYWFNDFNNRKKFNPSFLHIIFFAIFSFIFSFIFGIFHFEILRNIIEPDFFGALIFTMIRIIEGLMYSGIYRFLEKFFRG